MEVCTPWPQSDLVCSTEPCSHHRLFLSYFNISYGRNKTTNEPLYIIHCDRLRVLGKFVPSPPSLRPSATRLLGLAGINHAWVYWLLGVTMATPVNSRCEFTTAKRAYCLSHRLAVQIVSGNNCDINRWQSAKKQPALVTVKNRQSPFLSVRLVFRH